jgi:hypothetical protein
VRDYAQAAGVAVFAVTGMPLTSQFGGFVYRQNDANTLQAICELSGGMMTMTYPAMDGRILQRLIEMLRGRYILEFPRASNSTGGAHEMRVKVAKGESFFIRPSGISVPIPDPALLKDPTTVQAGPSQAPEQGNRRILKSPK